MHARRERDTVEGALEGAGEQVGRRSPREEPAWRNLVAIARVSARAPVRDDREIAERALVHVRCEVAVSGERDACVMRAEVSLQPRDEVEPRVCGRGERVPAV